MLTFDKYLFQVLNITVYSEVRQNGERIWMRSSRAPRGPTLGKRVVCQQMEVKPEDLNKGDGRFRAIRG